MLRLLAYLILAVALMVLDHRGGWLRTARAQADLAVEYAGLDRDREVSVEEMIERVSEPARPRRGRSGPRGRER